ncbi:MAG: OmpA family protein, partial [Bacteroidales bacterium]|nr:OmpA family protein [Bacteroidales bacterium]
GNESYPFVNVAGGLFFSSDGHPGYGGKDIYYTIQKDTIWLPPVRLDQPINSEYDDFSFTCDSTMSQGFFSSKRNTNTVDIYQFKTNIHQVFYCDNQRVNEYCFKFRDEASININTALLKYEWDFGDGSKAEGLVTEHCYSGPGKYKVSLNIIDRKTGRIFFTKLSYDLDLKEIEQPVIVTAGNSIAGSQMAFNGLSSHFPDSRILTYTWYFGDGSRDVGENVIHSYRGKGEYDVKLGLILKNLKTGVIYEACSVKKLNVFSNEQEKTAWEKSHKEQISRPYITDYDHAYISHLYSAEKELSQEIVWRVEIMTSKKRLDPGSDVFRNIPSKYNLRETYLPEENVYSYTINEEMDLMLTYVAFNEMISAGYQDTKVRTFILKDPAAKDLYAFLKIFGTSADNFFRKNDYTLTSSGTQLLDLIIGFMSKYPKLNLEIATHTDNQGSASSNMVLSQKRAESMVNYLIINGVPSTRLVAKGYGPTKPVASNMYEADRKLNRRVEFNILK